MESISIRVDLEKGAIDYLEFQVSSSIDKWLLWLFFNVLVKPFKNRRTIFVTDVQAIPSETSGYSGSLHLDGLYPNE